MGIKSKIQGSTNFIKDRAGAKKQEVSFTNRLNQNMYLSSLV
jgi:hypothetical protein